VPALLDREAQVVQDRVLAEALADVLETDEFT
jgi:hypothetical protein